MPVMIASKPVALEKMPVAVGPNELRRIKISFDGFKTRCSIFKRSCGRFDAAHDRFDVTRDGLDGTILCLDSARGRFEHAFRRFDGAFNRCAGILDHFEAMRVVDDGCMMDRNPVIS